MFKTNIMPFNTPLMCGSIPSREKSNKSNKVFHGLSNQQMGNKLQREVSNPRPLTIPSSDTMLNNQLSKKLKFVGFGFNMNILSFNTLLHVRLHTARRESNKPNKVHHGLLIQQMENKLQRGLEPKTSS